MSDSTRRAFLARSLCGCALCLPGVSALARVLPSEMQSLVTADYRPTDADERGMWQSCEQFEEKLANSNQLIRDPGIRDYLGGVIHRLLGPQIATNLRVYAVRDPDFNASMWPSGFMVVHSGLLARVRNEAQLAAVLGHEAGHYLRRHSVRNWRDMRNKSAVAAFVSVAGVVASGTTGTNYYDLANAISNGLVLSVLSFSREMESEADAFGLKLLNDAGYDPSAASAVWAQLIAERKVSAAALKKKYRDGAASSLSTHPPTEMRMRDLQASAIEIGTIRRSDAKVELHRDEYRAAVAPIRQMLIDEQVKLNDCGASLYLINSLAVDGWDGTLRFYEGEAFSLRGHDGDALAAANSYAAAVGFADAPPEAHRAHGYALIKAGNAFDGKRSLTRYLELKPDAKDAEMVRFSLQ